MPYSKPNPKPTQSGSRGLMDRALDLKPEVTQGFGFESWLWQEVSMTEVRPLSKAPPPTAPRAPPCRLPTAPGVCALGWVKCREHISLLIILCIIVYVTNKAHLSLICLFVCTDSVNKCKTDIKTYLLMQPCHFNFLICRFELLYRTVITLHKIRTGGLRLLSTSPYSVRVIN